MQGCVFAFAQQGQDLGKLLGAHALINNLEYFLAVSKNLAHPLHPVYDDGKDGGWKWWE